MGVKAADFKPMGEALIETIGAAMGDAFTPEMQQAWEAAFEEISRSLVAKGDIPGA